MDAAGTSHRRGRLSQTPQLLAASRFPTIRMRRFAVVAAAALTAVGTAAAPAAATARSTPQATVAYARCDDIAPQRTVVGARERFGPVTFVGNWNGYEQWLNMERLRSPEGTYYAKNGFGVRARAAGTLSIAPAYRDAADFIYGSGRNGRHVLSDVVRVRGCPRRGGFVSGGLIVRGPTCVLIEARRRGSRRVQRRMVSINMGANCPAT
jgi:hypothetical protein